MHADLAKAEQLFQQGYQLHQQQQLTQAKTCYEASLAINPKHFNALQLLGLIAQTEKNYPYSEQLFQQALQINPKPSSVHYNFALTLKQLQHYADALHYIQIYCKQFPEDLAGQFQLFDIHCLLEHDHSALQLGQQLIQNAQFNDAELRFLVYNNLSVIHKKLFQYQQQKLCAEAALQLKPHHHIATINLALAEMELGDLSQARQLLHQVLGEDKDNYEAHLVLSRFWDNVPGEIEHARHLLRLNPDDATTQQNLGVMEIMQGNLATGWQLLECRRDAKTEFNANYYQLLLPQWQGESLKDKHLVLLNEQGIGDEIFHASMYHEILPQAKKVSLLCSPRLVSIFARSFPSIECIGLERKVDWRHALSTPGDYCLDSGSLAKYFRNNIEAFAHKPAWLCADAHNSLKWRQWLQGFGNIKIGVSWRSFIQQGTIWRTSHYAPFKYWLELMQSLPQVTWVNLQYDDCTAELAELQSAGITIIDPPVNQMQELDQVLALIQQLDLVVGCSNSVMVMAAALKKTARLVYYHPFMMQCGTNAFPWSDQVIALGGATYQNSWPAIFAALKCSIQNILI